MQSILNNPKYGPRSELGTNMFTYLKFGLPRVLPPGKGEQVGNFIDIFIFIFFRSLKDSSERYIILKFVSPNIGRSAFRSTSFIVING